MIYNIEVWSFLLFSRGLQCPLTINTDNLPIQKTRCHCGAEGGWNEIWEGITAPVRPRGRHSWSTRVMREVKQQWIRDDTMRDNTSRTFCELRSAGQKAGSCVILPSPRKGNFLCLRKYSHYVSSLFGTGSLNKNLLRTETATWLRSF